MQLGCNFCGEGYAHADKEASQRLEPLETNQQNNYIIITPLA